MSNQQLLTWLSVQNVLALTAIYAYLMYQSNSFHREVVCVILTISAGYGTHLRMARVKLYLMIAMFRSQTAVLCEV